MIFITPMHLSNLQVQKKPYKLYLVCLSVSI